MDDRLKSGPSKIDIVVRKVRKLYSAKDVLKYMRDEGAEVAEDDIQVISHADLPTYTVRISIKWDDKDKVLNENFWPRGIESRIYFQRNQGKKQQAALEGNV